MFSQKDLYQILLKSSERRIQFQLDRLERRISQFSQRAMRRRRRATAISLLTGLVTGAITGATTLALLYPHRFIEPSHSPQPEEQGQHAALITSQELGQAILDRRYHERLETDSSGDSGTKALREEIIDRLKIR